MDPQTQSQPSPSPIAQSPQRRASPKLLAIVFVAAALVAGVYVWQHQKVTSLNQKVDKLTAQVHSLKVDLAEAQNVQSSGSSGANIPVYSGIQEKARNSKRQSDIAALQTQLEVFYSNNGYYPSLTNMNNPAWRTANMKSLDSGALADPSSGEQQQPMLSAVPAAKIYAYVVTNNTGASCEGHDTDCAKYILTATFEGTVNGKSTVERRNLD